MISLTTAFSVHAQTEPAPEIEDLPEAYFVELYGPPVADGGSLADLAAEKVAFRSAAQKAGLQIHERRSFDKLWNGLSVEVSALDVTRLARVDGVKAVYPVGRLERPPLEPAEEGAALDMATSLVQSQGHIAQNELGLTGRGIKVAVIDTGVDYHHPELGGCFGPGCKVEGGYDFFDNDPFPDDNCVGHGTHVAGIIAGSGPVVRGVAPEATLLAYRVIGCQTGAALDVYITAMERAWEDGADVLNMSFGTPAQWPQYPLAQAADRLVRKGVVVVCSAGNSGNLGLYYTGAPSVGDKVIATASVNTAAEISQYIASLSSLGPSPELTLKPDLAAPGVPVLSTFPLELGTYASFGGTSMAAPHVAGGAALLLQARPNTPATAVRTIFQNTASSRTSWYGFGPEITYRQGAGMIQIADAIRATARVEPGKLSLGESEHGPVTRTLTVENNGPAAVTYTLSHDPALSTFGTFFLNPFFGWAALASFSTPTLTVPAGGTATFDVTFTADPNLPDKSLYSGFVVLTPQTGGQPGGQTLRVPYAGFKGDYQSIQALNPTLRNYPWLARLNSFGALINHPTGATYNLPFETPMLAVHLDHPVRRLRVEVFDADTGKAWHTAYEQEYRPRNSGPTSASLIPWDGITTAGNKTYVVPSGRYILKMTVVKALGDEDNPAHVETWTSPVLTLVRP